jgi:hypothetical protein
MINIRIELELIFDKTSVALTPAYSIFSKLSDAKSPKPPHEPGVTLRNEQIKRAFKWDYNSCGILYEDVINYNDCLAQFVKLLDEVNNIVPIGKISTQVLRTFWVIPVKYDFAALETKHRNMFIKDNVLFNNIFDSTFVIESKIDSADFHHQSGAMTLNQLQSQYRVFKQKEAFPNIFLFMAATLTSRESIEYSNQSMGEYIQRAFQICKSHSDNFQRTMEGVL